MPSFVEIVVAGLFKLVVTWLGSVGMTVVGEF